MKFAKTPMGPMEVMISLSIPKVNLSHLAYFDTHRDCSVVEDDPAARTIPPAEHAECLCLPRGTRRTIEHTQNTFGRPDSDASDRAEKRKVDRPRPVCV